MKFSDGRVDEYAVNIIIENIIDQIGDQGWYTRILEEIVAFRNDSGVSIPTGDQSYTNVNEIQRQVIITKSLEVKVKWRDQSTYWFPLHIIKESNHIEVLEHAMANGYSDEPSFRLWVRKVSNKSDRAVKTTKSSFQKNIFKYGVEVPLIVEDALIIDR